MTHEPYCHIPRMASARVCKRNNRDDQRDIGRQRSTGLRSAEHISLANQTCFTVWLGAYIITAATWSIHRTNDEISSTCCLRGKYSSFHGWPHLEQTSTIDLDASLCFLLRLRSFAILCVFHCRLLISVFSFSSRRIITLRRSMNFSFDAVDYYLLLSAGQQAVPFVDSVAPIFNRAEDFSSYRRKQQASARMNCSTVTDSANDPILVGNFGASVFMATYIGFYGLTIIVYFVHQFMSNDSDDDSDDIPSQFFHTFRDINQRQQIYSAYATTTSRDATLVFFFRSVDGYSLDQESLSSLLFGRTDEVQVH